MIYIAGSLFGGWVLNLFGFDSLIISGMNELFGLSLSKTGYYAMFGLLGMGKSLMSATSWVGLNRIKDSITQK